MKTIIKTITIIVALVFVFINNTIEAQTVTSTEVFTVGDYESSDVSDNKTYVNIVVTNVNNGQGLTKTLEIQPDGRFTLINTCDLIKGNGSSDAVQYVVTTISNSGTNFVDYMYGWSGDDGLARLQKNLPDGTSVTVLEYVNDGIATMKVIGNDLYCVFGAGANFDPGTLGGLPNLSGGYYLLKISGTSDQYVWSTFLGNSFVWNYDVKISENLDDPNNVYLTWANGDLQKFSRSDGSDLGLVKTGISDGTKYKFDANGNLQCLISNYPGYSGSTLLIYDKNDNYNSIIYMTDWSQANLWNETVTEWKISNGLFYGLFGSRILHLNDKLIHGYIKTLTNVDGFGGGWINDDGTYSGIVTDVNLVKIVTVTDVPEDKSLIPTLNDSDPNIVTIVNGKIYDGTNWVDAYHQGTIIFADGTLPSIGDTPDPSWVNASDGIHLIILFPIEIDPRNGDLIFRGVYRKDNTASDDINLKVILVEESNVTIPETYSVSIEKTSDAYENGSDAVFTISVNPTNNSGSAITGDINYTGSATEGVDYTGVSNFSIPNGSSSTTITLTVNDDSEVEETESIIATISNISNGTIGTSSAEANLFDNDTSSGIKEIETEISIYPNPTRDILYISSDNYINIIEIYDISGKLCFQRNPFSNLSVNISELKSGIYFMRILVNGHFITKKIMKE